mmetsp:Transcript_113589/g.331894  ORF Transcript_113589/g.331894 Transcript_113589/m.331894 type:complete len:246 (+) Transcript_113589:23-760(+)
MCEHPAFAAPAHCRGHAQSSAATLGSQPRAEIGQLGLDLRASLALQLKLQVQDCGPNCLRRARGGRARAPSRKQRAGAAQVSARPQAAALAPLALALQQVLLVLQLCQRRVQSSTLPRQGSLRSALRDARDAWSRRRRNVAVRGLGKQPGGQHPLRPLLGRLRRPPLARSGLQLGLLVARLLGRQIARGALPRCALALSLAVSESWANLDSKPMASDGTRAALPQGVAQRKHANQVANLQALQRQ